MMVPCKTYLSLAFIPKDSLFHIHSALAVFAGAGGTDGAAGAAAPLGCNGSSVSGMGVDPNNPRGTDDAGTGGGTDDGGQSGYCAGSGPPIVVGDTGTSSSALQRAGGGGGLPLWLVRLQRSRRPTALPSMPLTVRRPARRPLAAAARSAATATSIPVAGSRSAATCRWRQQQRPEHHRRPGSAAQPSLNQSQVTVGRNAQVGGDINISGLLKVTGTLTVPAGKVVNASTKMIGSTVNAAVSVPAPATAARRRSSHRFLCRGASQQQRQRQHSARPRSLQQLPRRPDPEPALRALLLNRITGAGKLTLGISGRTALFIGSDVNIESDLRVQITGSGELDLFLNGNLTSSAPLNFGDRSAPARVRLYMAGSRNINLSANSVINGNIYAPEGALVTSGSLTVYGAIFVSSFNNSGAVNIHHDIAVLKAADSCTPTSGGAVAAPIPTSAARARTAAARLVRTTAAPRAAPAITTAADRCPATAASALTSSADACCRRRPARYRDVPWRT